MSVSSYFAIILISASSYFSIILVSAFSYFTILFVPTTSSFAIILVSAPSSCFTLDAPMREVSCVGYTPRAWEPGSLQCPYYIDMIVSCSTGQSLALH